MSDNSIFLQSGTVLLEPTSHTEPWNNRVEEAGDGVHWHGYFFGNRAWIIFGEQMQPMFCGLLVEFGAAGEKLIEPFSHFRRISVPQASNPGIAEKYPRQQSQRDRPTEVFRKPDAPNHWMSHKATGHYHAFGGKTFSS